MIARIAKTFTFDAAHHLTGLPPDHPCERMHGHTYSVDLQLVGPVQRNGFVLDYADIARVWKHVHELVDHRLLNEVPGLEQPTTENLAAWIVEKIAGHPMFAIQLDERDEYQRRTRKPFTLLERVIVRESSTTWCEVLVGDLHQERGSLVPLPAASTSALYARGNL